MYFIDYQIIIVSFIARKTSCVATEKKHIDILIHWISLSPSDGVANKSK